MRKITSALATIVFYIVFGLTLVFFHILQIITLNIFGYSVHKKTVDILNLFIILELKYILGVTYTLHNFVDLASEKPIIFIANHQSTYDVPPLIWFLRKYHVKFVAKKELLKFIPSISYNLKHGGSVAIDRENPEEAKKAIKRFGEYITKNNYSVLIFPEGSRSKTSDMKPFKVGGVKTLLDNIPEAIIVPIAIKGSWKVSKYGGWLKSFGEKVAVEMLNPMEYTGSNENEFVNSVQEKIQISLNRGSEND